MGYMSLCQDKFRQFYKSPYEGNGHSDVENDSDDEDEEEEGNCNYLSKDILQSLF